MICRRGDTVYLSYAVISRLNVVFKLVYNLKTENGKSSKLLESINVLGRPTTFPNLKYYSSDTQYQPRNK